MLLNLLRMTFGLRLVKGNAVWSQARITPTKSNFRYACHPADSPDLPLGKVLGQGWASGGITPNSEEGVFIHADDHLLKFMATSGGHD
jgi:hypothetical protein